MKVNAFVANAMSSGVYPPVFHKFSERGIYVLRFFKNFAWRYVIIDERLPVVQETGELAFAKCRRPDELWVSYIEKAYAKLFGNY
jgi:calpain, invertebrate